MKTIAKSSSPSVLVEFAQAFPRANWQAFRNHLAGRAYQATKQQLGDDQDYLCAYCERALNREAAHLQRIEHFHPKADTSSPHNWALDWGNMLMVCMGGSNKDEIDHDVYPLPANLSCDAYKDHCITTKSLPENCEEYVLNPLVISAHKLFEFDKSTGKLAVNAELQDISLVQKAKSTIEFLNLNCAKLCEERLLILNQYNQIIKKAKSAGNRLVFQQLATSWLSEPYKSFFTTRRSLLAVHADTYLAR